MPSSTVENYVKEIYLVGQRVGTSVVSMGDVARALGVAPGTATAMMKSLATAGWVEYQTRVGVSLTSDGRTLALGMIRRHRLVELFLVETLGLDWAEIHEEAEQLEHAVSERVLEALDNFLGNPLVDPHGDPIPSPKGDIAVLPDQHLGNCQLNKPLRVVRINDQDPNFLKFAETQGLKPGAEVCVLQRSETADSVTLIPTDGATSVTIGMSAAHKIWIEELANK